MFKTRRVLASAGNPWCIQGMFSPKLPPKDEKALQDMIDRGVLPGHRIEEGRLRCPQQDRFGRPYLTAEDMEDQRKQILGRAYKKKS